MLKLCQDFAALKVLLYWVETHEEVVVNSNPGIAYKIIPLFEKDQQ